MAEVFHFRPFVCKLSPLLFLPYPKSFFLSDPLPLRDSSGHRLQRQTDDHQRELLIFFKELFPYQLADELPGRFGYAIVIGKGSFFFAPFYSFIFALCSPLSLPELSTGVC